MYTAHIYMYTPHTYMHTKQMYTIKHTCIHTTNSQLDKHTDGDREVFSFRHPNITGRYLNAVSCPLSEHLSPR